MNNTILLISVKKQIRYNYLNLNKKYLFDLLSIKSIYCCMKGISTFLIPYPI